MKYALFLFSLFMSFSVNAASNWEIKGNYIESYRVFYLAPYNVLQIYFKEPINTGCAVSDNSKSVAIWQNGHLNAANLSWLSAIMAAHAQGNRVDVLVGSGDCHNQYGRRLQGVSVLK